jgi:uncharacterized delta-60 repeat protein
VKKAVVMLVVVLFGFALALGYARANPGALDPTWGDEGVVLTDFEGMDDILNTLTLMPDEKLAAAGWVNVWPGDYGVARYLRDGRLDPSFGDGGLVTTAFFDDPDLVDAAWAITARPDGGLYVFGETCDADYEICQFGLAAYNADGSLDESFGDGGLVVTNVDDVYSVYAWPTRNILQPDGKLVAGGIALYGDDDVDIVLIRYNPDGSLDDTFGDGGLSVTDFEGRAHFTQDILALPDGKIMVAGGATAAYEGFTYMGEEGYLARFNSDGSVDTTFGGGDGILTVKYNDDPTLIDSAMLTADGHLIVNGVRFLDVENQFGGDCTLQRYDLDGVLDTSFGDNGWTLIDTGLADTCWGADLTPDGKVVFTGHARTPEPPEAQTSVSNDTRRNPVMGRGVSHTFSTTACQNDFFDMFVGRYNADGTPDETFGEGGLTRFTYNDGAGTFFAIAAQQDGKLLVIGDVVVDEMFDFGIIRFLGDGPAAQVYAPMVSR